MNLAFSAYRPSTVLFPFVQSYWSGDFNVRKEKDFTQSVVPNGCVEVIIHLTDEHCALTKDKALSAASPAFTVLGIQSKPYEVRFATNVKVFGIRFFPDGIRNVLGVSPSEFSFSYVDGEDLFNNSFRDFCRSIREARSEENKIRLANHFLERQLQRHFNPHDYTHRMMRLIREGSGQRRYRDIAGEIAISGRQLQRTFKGRYGITVTEYMRLARMNTIYRYMQSGEKTLTEVTHDLEFFDQSHFIREFRNYVGVAPRTFIREREQFIVNQWE